MKELFCFHVSISKFKPDAESLTTIYVISFFHDFHILNRMSQRNGKAVVVY